MTAVLGISAFYHDSAAALIVDGDIVAAAQEERFTRKKHDDRFPQHAIDYCLSEARLRPQDLDHVGFYDKPILKFDRLLETYLAFAPRGYRSFRRALPLWLKQKLHLRREIKKELRDQFDGRIVFTEHHQSHAASAFFPSPFDEAAIITFDGVGEWSTTCHGVGRSNKLELHREIRFPHSLGLLYSAFTYYTGFRVNSGEYKVMGLAPYGQPVFRDLILRHVMDLKDDGSFRLDMRYFNYCQGLTMTSARFHKLFGGPPRQPESELTQREMDLAASIQSVTEEVMLRTARHVYNETGLKNLTLAGGVALNSVGNGKILRESPFENVWIQPAAGDAGGALGVAQFIWHQLLENDRPSAGSDRQHGSFLGPAFPDDDIRQFLEQNDVEYRYCASIDQLCDEVATLIDDEKVVGWFQGRMEFGPRALGARSILGDARSDSMQSVMNEKIKFRESFRPFAPIVLREYVNEYFELRPEEDCPYMSLVAPVREEHREFTAPNQDKAHVTQQSHHRRSCIPAVTHVDYSSRVQTVDAERNPLLHNLLSRFHEQTGCPVLINTSFNVRGEPVVCTPEDAYQCFMATDMDVLVMGCHLIHKRAQKQQNDSGNGRQYLAQFPLD